MAKPQPATDDDKVEFLERKIAAIEGYLTELHRLMGHIGIPPYDAHLGSGIVLAPQLGSAP